MIAEATDKKQLSVKIDAALYAALDKMAHEQRRTKTAVLELLIERAKKEDEAADDAR